MRVASLSLAAALLALLSASSISAQAPIRVGQTLSGRLSRTDQKFSDGSFYKKYGFIGSKGDSVTVELVSDDFDANLLIADASGNTLARNDDGGGACNARVVFGPRETGNYLIFVNSSAQAELGAYRVSVARGRSRAPADTTCRGFGRVAGGIEVGETISGKLTSNDPEVPDDSTYFQRWILSATPNQAFTVDLESNDFDSYLLLTNGRGQKLVENDDGGGGCNARLVYTPKDDHPLRIIVNTASKPRYQTGNYTLRVLEGASPTEAKGNCRANTASAGPTVQQASANVTRSSSSGVQTSSPSTTIRVGETVNGALTSADSVFPDTTYFKVYWFSPTPGREITIDLASDEFDPMLIIGGGDLERPIVNDDGGPGCNSRVVRTFPGRGPYRIRVNTTTDPHLQTGRYTLSITDGAKPVQERGNSDCQPSRSPNGSESGSRRPASTATHSISVGQTQQGSLTRDDVLLTHDSTYAEAWTINGRAGQTITIDLESDDFDSYLFLRGPGISGGRDFQDADSGGNCHARLTATLPQNGEYEIVVNTEGKYATGGFTLSVTSGSKPKSVSRCNRSQ